MESFIRDTIKFVLIQIFKKILNLRHRYIARNRFTHNRGSCLFPHKTTLILLTPILSEATAAGGNY